MTSIAAYPIAPEFSLEIAAPWECPPTLAPRVEAIWQAQKERHGERLTNGRVYGLDSFGADVLRIRQSDYRHVLARRHAPDLIARGLTLRPLGVTGILLCADGLVLGLRGGHVATDAGLWEAAPAGGLSIPDPRAQVLEELHEELGLTVADVTSVQACGLVEEPDSGVFDIVFRLETALSGQAVLAAQRALATDEYAQLAIVGLSELPAFLACERHRILPVLAPMLRLAGLL